MSIFDDLLGTINNTLQIGVGGTGARTLRFKKASAQADLIWNPTANRQITFPDANSVAGQTLQATDTNGTLQWVATRSVNSISSNTSAGSTALVDYVYLVTGITTITLPTAVGNANRYTIKRVGTNTVTIATTSSQTIDGDTSIQLTIQYQSIDLISDGSNWSVI